MNKEIEQLLLKQARWQQSRRALSWPEKIRMAVQMRDALGRWGQAFRKNVPLPGPRSNPEINKP